MSAGRRTIPWSETRRRLRADRARATSLYPAFCCAALHRLSHHFHTRGRKRLAHLFWRINLGLTGADIDPSAAIGPGLLVPQPAGVFIDATAGSDLTVMALGGIGQAPERGAVSFHPDNRPTLGDGCVIGVHAGVFGRVRLGDGVLVCAGAFALRDVPAKRAIVPPRVRMLGGAERPEGAA